MIRRRYAFGFVVLVSLTLSALAGCGLIVDSLQDGFADFLETTTANLLERAFPVPTPADEGGDG